MEGGAAGRGRSELHLCFDLRGGYLGTHNRTIHEAVHLGPAQLTERQLHLKHHYCLISQIKYVSLGQIWTVDQEFTTSLLNI